MKYNSLQAVVVLCSSLSAICLSVPAVAQVTTAPSPAPAGNANEGHDHKHYKFEELPQVVRTTIDKYREQAEITHIFSTRTNQGQEVFVVEFKIGSSDHQLAVLGDGLVLKHEESLSLEQLPPKVRELTLKTAGGATLDLIEKVTRPGSTSVPLSYEVKWTVDDLHHTVRIVLLESGEPLIIDHKKE